MLNENIRNLRKAKGLSQEECLNEENMKNIAEKLEVINLQLAKTSSTRIRIIRYLLILLDVIITIIFITFAAMGSVFITFAAMGSEYLAWNFNDPELAIAGTLLHGFEFLFVRVAPFLFIGSIIGILFTYKKR